jgi:hypothetical protein
VTCAALPPLNVIDSNPFKKKHTISITNETETPDTKIEGNVKSYEPTASTNHAQLNTQSKQTSKSVLSTVKTPVITLSSISAITFLALFALQRR